MTTTDRDPALSSAFRSLEGTLAPPLDADRLVRAGITRRRRRRTSAMAAGGGAALVTVGALVVVGVGGEEPTEAVDRPADQPTTTTVVMSRPDGSTYAFDELDVACEPAHGKQGQRLVLTSPIRTEGPRDAERLLEPIFYVDVVVDRVELGRDYTLPLEQDRASELSLFSVFAADIETRPGVGNEASGAEPGAAGTVRFDAASCGTDGTDPVVDVTVDATLGSEVGMGTLAVSGRAAVS